MGINNPMKNCEINLFEIKRSVSTNRIIFILLRIYLITQILSETRNLEVNGYPSKEYLFGQSVLLKVH